MKTTAVIKRIVSLPRSFRKRKITNVNATCPQLIRRKNSERDRHVRKTTVVMHLCCFSIAYNTPCFLRASGGYKLHNDQAQSPRRCTRSTYQPAGKHLTQVSLCRRYTASQKKTWCPLLAGLNKFISALNGPARAVLCPVLDRAGPKI